jgi:hypothetical protein
MAEQDDEPVQQAEGPVSSEEPSPRGVLSRILPALAGTAAMYGAMQGLGTIATDQGPGRGVLSRLWQFHRLRRMMGVPYGGVELRDAPFAAYSPSGGYVMGPSNMSDGTIAHELGHAINHETLAPNSNWFMATQFPGRALPLTLPAALYSAGAARPSLVPGALVALLNAPVLADEAAASAQAAYHLARTRGLRGLADAATLLPAFGTYAVNALGPLGIAMLRRGLADRERRPSDAEST